MNSFGEFKKIRLCKMGSTRSNFKEIAKTMIDFSLSSIPKTAGIYAMYDRSGGVAYVGISGTLQNRIRDHITYRKINSATVLNLDKVSRICWWLNPRFSDKAYREAAEVVAFKELNPSLRSRGKVTKRAKDVLEDQTFRDEMARLFRGKPSGVFYPKTLDNLVDLVLKLEKRVSELEKQRKL